VLQDKTTRPPLVPSEDLDRLLLEPTASINEPIRDSTLTSFLERLALIRSNNQDLVLELTTTGGDADVARRIALEVRLFSAHTGRMAVCVGKSYVYSAGVTIFAAFEKANRYLTEDTILLVHERRLEKTIDLSGPITANIQIIRETLSMLETAQRLEKEGFAELVKGSTLDIDGLFECAKKNCYFTAQQCIDYSLIAKILS
jgi:ATP-dependent Clp protease protease subunit